MALYTHFLMVSSLSFAHKSWERSWNYPQKFPQDQGQSSEQNLGQSQQLCFFLPPTYLRRAVCLLPRTRPPPAVSGWGLGSASSPQAHCLGGTGRGPATQDGELDLDLGRDRKLFWQQAPGRGWGEATCPLEGNHRTQLGEAGGPWAPTTLCAPSVTSHSPLGEKSPGLGATRTHPCFNRLWARGPFKFPFRRPS